MLSVWWDFKGIVYFELLPRNQTINSNVYCRQLMKQDKEFKENRPELATRKGVIFHKDNARPLTSSDPRTWELAAPIIDPTSSWLLPRSTAIGWLNEEGKMSSRHLWWGLPAPTFWDHCKHHWSLAENYWCQAGK